MRRHWQRTIRERLAEILKDLGYQIEPEALVSNRNGWGIHYGEISWHAYGQHNGQPCYIAGWGPMRACVRHGMDVYEEMDGILAIEVWPKEA